MIADIGMWATCEASALHGSRTPARRSAAAWVAHLAHGGDAKERDHRPVAFDGATPTASVAERQAGWVRLSVDEAMERRGWTVETRSAERQVYGVSTREGAAGIVCVRLDRVGTAWLDVGGLIDDLGGKAKELVFAAVLVLDRAMLGRKGYADVDETTRPAAGLVEAYRVLRERREVVLEGAAAMHAPGIHCARCRLAGCPVRSHDGPGGVT